MFIIPPADENHPIEIYQRLLACPEHSHLLDHKPDVAFLFRDGEWVKKGRSILGTCSMPSVQGDLRPLFDWMLEELLGFTPVFLFTLSFEWWEQADERQREILVFHEMCHAAQDRDKYGSPRINQQTGEPVWTIRPHDIEEFNSVVRRYGAWAPDVQDFIAAVQAGEAENPNSAVARRPDAHEGETPRDQPEE